MPTRRIPPTTQLRTVQTRLKEIINELDDLAQPGAMQHLTTVEEVVAVYKSKSELARLTGSHRQQVLDWIKQGFFATNTYKIITEDLARKGYTAAPGLWRMKE